MTETNPNLDPASKSWVYTVTGMSCGHCVHAVTEEISKIHGVSEVAVDLASGAVTVRSSQSISDADVRAAVEEAGYELVASQNSAHGQENLHEHSS